MSLAQVAQSRDCRKCVVGRDGSSVKFIADRRAVALDVLMEGFVF